MKKKKVKPDTIQSIAEKMRDLDKIKAAIAKIFPKNKT